MDIEMIPDDVIFVSLDELNEKRLEIEEAEDETLYEINPRIDCWRYMRAHENNYRFISDLFTDSRPIAPKTMSRYEFGYDWSHLDGREVGDKADKEQRDKAFNEVLAGAKREAKREQVWKSKIRKALELKEFQEREEKRLKKERERQAAYRERRREAKFEESGGWYKKTEPDLTEEPGDDDPIPTREMLPEEEFYRLMYGNDWKNMLHRDLEAEGVQPIAAKIEAYIKRKKSLPKERVEIVFDWFLKK